MSYKKEIAKYAGMLNIPCFFELLHKTPRILFYHGIEKKTISDKRVQANQMDFCVFEKQIEYLNKHFHFISIDEFYERFSSRKPFTGKEVVLTFDDGYKNNYTVAAPFLKSLDIPFTVFISAENIDKGTRVPTYYVRSAIFNPQIKRIDIPSLKQEFSLSNETERLYANDILIRAVKTKSNEFVHCLLQDINSQISNDVKAEMTEKFQSEDLMSWDDVVNISIMGATIGSHCLDHAILHGNQKNEEIVRQLKESKALIEKHVGKCDYFAFPNGDRTSVCEFALQQTLKYYKMGFAVNGKRVRHRENTSFISRIGICDDFYAFRTQFSILSV